MKWVSVTDKCPATDRPIEVKVKHCNAKKLNLKDKIVSGKFGDDGFYLIDGGELSYNWDIIQWRGISIKRIEVLI